MIAVAVTVSLTAAPPALAQHPVFTNANLDARRTIEFTLEPVAGCRLLALDGPLQIGVTSALKSALADHPDTTGLVLASDGGNVYQARGLATIVAAHSLDTYVVEKCHSACTTVFLAGARRYVGTRATIGFHDYRMDDGRAHPGVDVAREQRRDRAVIAQQIADTRFVEQLSRHTGRQLWTPSVSTLLDFGVAHGEIRGAGLDAPDETAVLPSRRLRCDVAPGWEIVRETLANAATTGRETSTMHE